MANTKSAKKAMRQTLKRTIVNRIRKSRVRTFVRKARESFVTTSPENNANAAHEAYEALKAAQSELMRAGSKGVLPKKRASRYVARLTKRYKSIFEEGRTASS